MLIGTVCRERDKQSMQIQNKTIFIFFTHILSIFSNGSSPLMVTAVVNRTTEEALRSPTDHVVVKVG